MGLLVLLRLRGLLGLGRGVVLGRRRRVIFGHRCGVVLRHRSRTVFRYRTWLVVLWGGRARRGLRLRDGTSLGDRARLDGLRRLIDLGWVGLIFGPVLRRHGAPL